MRASLQLSPTTTPLSLTSSRIRKPPQSEQLHDSNRKSNSDPRHQNPPKLQSLQQSIKTMGLQNQLNDISTDSIPLLLIATIATSVSHLRSIFLTFLHFLHLHHPTFDPPTLLHGSGFANLVVLADQLNMNRMFSHKYGDRCQDNAVAECVVCLCDLKEGENVRRLPCRHVFHKSCFDGWLDHLNFNCPLCRSPLVERGDGAGDQQRRVGAEAVAWFGVH